MTVQPTGHPEVRPTQALAAGVALVIGAVLTLTTASIDPWLLVLLAGLGIVTYSLTRSDW
jgi:heme O synthase-like polyprenyltransferase